MIYNVCNCKYDTINISNQSFNFYVPFKVHWSYGVPFVNTYECAAQKLISFIDFRSAMFCSNVMENTCNF